MRIIVTADIHNGYPKRIDDTIASMCAMSEYADDNGIEKIIVLGDFHHNRNHISIDVWNKLTAFLESERDKHEWVLFPGNHDMFMKTGWDINSVKPLGNLATVINDISSVTIDGRRFVVLPFVHFESSYMDAMKKLEDSCGPDDVLLTHIGVNNAINNTCFLLKNWSMVSFTESKFPLILSGHFHTYQVVDDKLCYPGSPIPFRFDEGGVPHGFLDLDTDSLAVNFIDLWAGRDIKPPDFVTIIDEVDGDRITDSSSKRIKSISGNRIRVVLSREYSKSELDQIRSKLIEIGAVSVSWMKSDANDEQKATIAPSVSPTFESWLATKDLAQYDINLIKKLHAQIAEEADELFASSVEVE